jgi:hypothetical protein
MVLAVEEHCASRQQGLVVAQLANLANAGLAQAACVRMVVSSRAGPPETLPDCLADLRRVLHDVGGAIDHAATTLGEEAVELLRVQARRAETPVERLAALLGASRAAG